jgi:ADP-ribose pyrophosphatase YjhB (NUDIX family)
MSGAAGGRRRTDLFRDRAMRTGLVAYAHMPRALRQVAVRSVMPSFTVGVMPIITRDDGWILGVQHTYMARWGFPGGLVNRRERVEDAVVREAREEVGLHIRTVGEAMVTVNPWEQVVRVAWRAVLEDGDRPEMAHPASPEILMVRWLDPDHLPDLAPEAREALRTVQRAERWRAHGPDTIER